MKYPYRKILCAVLCAVLCLSMLAGCASRGVSPDGPPPAAASDGQSQPEDQQTMAPVEEEEPPLDCDILTGAAPDPARVGRRPVAVMIDNIPAALPQSGIAAASVVYEMVTEGGIPRMMAVFSDTGALGKVGPVRSTRDQFVQLLVPANLRLLHIGCSIYAADMLRTIDYDTVDGIYLGTLVFAMDSERAKGRDNAHCFYTEAALAEAGLAHEGIAADGEVAPLFRFVPYTRPARQPSGGAAQAVDFSFSDVAAVSLHYNAETARYYKSEYGDPQMDEATGEQLSYTNLLVLGCTVNLKSDGLCTDFVLTEGDGFYFSQGASQPIRWKKGALTQPLTLYDLDGRELAINVGTSYVALVDAATLQATLRVDGADPYAPPAPPEDAAAPADSTPDSAATDGTAAADGTPTDAPTDGTAPAEGENAPVEGAPAEGEGAPG